MNTDGSVGIHIEFSNLDPLVACPPQALRVAAEFRPLSQPLCVPELCALCASVPLWFVLLRLDARRQAPETDPWQPSIGIVLPHDSAVVRNG